MAWTASTCRTGTDAGPNGSDRGRLEDVGRVLGKAAGIRRFFRSLTSNLDRKNRARLLDIGETLC
jgi:hypothetical protein